MEDSIDEKALSIPEKNTAALDSLTPLENQTSQDSLTSLDSPIQHDSPALQDSQTPEGSPTPQDGLTLRDSLTPPGSLKPNDSLTPINSQESRTLMDSPTSLNSPTPPQDPATVEEETMLSHSSVDDGDGKSDEQKHFSLNAQEDNLEQPSISADAASDHSSLSKDEVTPSKSKRRISSDSEQEEITPSKRRFSFSDSETEDAPTPFKKNRIDSDDEENFTTTKAVKMDSDDEELGFSSAKAAHMDSDDEELGSSTNVNTAVDTADKPAGSDAEASDKDQAIADIFGDSSDEEEEFEGFDESEIKKTAVTEDALPEVSSDDELEDDRRANRADFVSDFDLMLAKKKAERSTATRRRRKNVDIINDSDDLIVDMLKRMKEAAEEDRELNKNHQPATRKLTMLSYVVRQLNKSELQPAFMDCGVLSAITEWLAPLSDKSLPHLQIREAMLKILISFPHPHTDQLKSSGIGKAVMYLFKHPKEIRQNRDMAGRLINEWSRPIFGQSANYKTVSREERERRDHEQIPRNRRRSSDSAAKKEDEAQRALKPGDPGWLYRARVPRPSNKDYVIRPHSNIDDSYTTTKSKKEITRFEKQKRKMAEKKRNSKQQRAVAISIEGRNMAL